MRPFEKLLHDAHSRGEFVTGQQVGCPGGDLYEYGDPRCQLQKVRVATGFTPLVAGLRCDNYMSRERHWGVNAMALLPYAIDAMDKGHPLQIGLAGNSPARHTKGLWEFDENKPLENIEAAIEACRPEWRNYGELLNTLASMGGTVAAMWGHEGNGDWYWYGNYRRIKHDKTLEQIYARGQLYANLYRAMYEQLHDEHSHMNHVSFVWAPSSKAEADPSASYPGADVVNIYGVSHYGRPVILDHHTKENAKFPVRQRQYLGYLYELAKQNGQPFLWGGELGPSQDEKRRPYKPNSKKGPRLAKFDDADYLRADSHFVGGLRWKGGYTHTDMAENGGSDYLMGNGKTLTLETRHARRRPVARVARHHDAATVRGRDH